MKHLVILSLLLLWALCLLANPMEFILVSEFWFNEDGELLIELCPSYQGGVLEVPLSNLQFTYNGQTSVITNPPDSLDYYHPLVVNLSEFNPPLYPPHSGGSVSISQIVDMGYYPGEQFGWGANMPPEGSSFVHWYSHADTGQWGWAIEIPPTPGTHPYSPQTRGRLKAYCYDQFYNPIPGVQVYFHADGYHGGETDANGAYEDTLYATNVNVSAYYPAYPTQVFSINFRLQPNQLTEVDIPITITANGDAVVPASVQTGLTIYPVPYRFTANAGLNFQLPDTVKKSGQIKLKIYNAKGQYVTELTTRQGNLLQWQPESDISAGIYTVRLICDNRIVETGHFSILK